MKYEQLQNERNTDNFKWIKQNNANRKQHQNASSPVSVASSLPSDR